MLKPIMSQPGTKFREFEGLWVDSPIAPFSHVYYINQSCETHTLRLQVEGTGVLPTETIIRQAVENLMVRINLLQTELSRAEQQAGMEARLI